MLYALCSQPLVNTGLQCSQACLVALRMTFFRRFEMCLAAKRYQFEHNIAIRATLTRARIVAKRGHSLLHGHLSVFISRWDGFHQLS